jgi:hypothetical protein
MTSFNTGGLNLPPQTLDEIRAALAAVPPFGPDSDSQTYLRLGWGLAKAIEKAGTGGDAVAMLTAHSPAWSECRRVMAARKGRGNPGAFWAVARSFGYAPTRSPISDDTLAQINDCLPRFLERRGFLPGVDASKSRLLATCPICGKARKFQTDKVRGVWLGKCWSAGCALSGRGAVDLIGLVARLEDLDPDKDFRRIAELAASEVGVTIAESTGPRLTRAERDANAERRRLLDEQKRREDELAALDRAAKRAAWPVLVESPERGVANVARLRGIPLAGVRAAHDWGHLRFGTWKGEPCWILRDHRGLAAEARRMDGKRFFGEGGPKALALEGSEKKHALIGEHLLGTAPDPVILAEGGPDFLCACFLAWRSMEFPGATWIPLGFLGANAEFSEDQLDLLVERTVRVFVHDDDAGRDAAHRWRDALESVGANVQLIHVGDLAATLPDGSPARDLNDALRAAADPEEFARLATAPF